jgi:hypothetical protein
MLALALVLHLLAAPAGEGGPATIPGGPRGEATPPSASPDGTGSAVEALAARPSVELAPTPRPSLAPQLRGPFGGRELAMAGLGALAGDALVLGAGYGALQLFAHGAVAPTRDNFRRAAFATAGAALVVPPLLAVLGARLVAGAHAGSLWKAVLLATAGHALALAAGYWASPHLWAFVPAQLVAVGAGTSFGLHWGPRRRDLGARRAVPDAAPTGPPLAWSAVACSVAR